MFPLFSVGVSIVAVAVAVFLIAIGVTAAVSIVPVFSSNLNLTKLAQIAGVARCTSAGEGVDAIHAGGSIGAGVGQTVVNVCAGNWRKIDETLL